MRIHNKVGIIIIYFGKWPDWIFQFISGCERNADFDFIIMNDTETVLSESENIKNILFTKDDFNALATKKLGLDIKLMNSYKLCDFKPAFGKIFEDYLKDYDYWGVSDIDMILGELSQLLNTMPVDKYDLISLYKDYISAPFFLVKNTEYLNSAFEQIHAYREYLNHAEYLGFDENRQTSGKKPAILRRCFYILQFLVVSLLRFDLLKSPMAELKFNLYWYLKKKKIDIPSDFTEVIYKLSGENKISPLFMNMLESDKSLSRKGINQWRLEYRNGKIFESCSKKEIPVFHFLKSKNLNFKVQDNISTDFIVTPAGFSSYE
jgi:hypothetical protein